MQKLKINKERQMLYKVLAHLVMLAERYEGYKLYEQRNRALNQVELLSKIIFTANEQGNISNRIQVRMIKGRELK